MSKKNNKIGKKETKTMNETNTVNEVTPVEVPASVANLTVEEIREKMVALKSQLKDLSIAMKAKNPAGERGPSSADIIKEFIEKNPMMPLAEIQMKMVSDYGTKYAPATIISTSRRLWNAFHGVKTKKQLEAENATTAGTTEAAPEQAK